MTELWTVDGSTGERYAHLEGDGSVPQALLQAAFGSGILGTRVGMNHCTRREAGLVF